jgi:hypothetical protein
MTDDQKAPGGELVEPAATIPQKAAEKRGAKDAKKGRAARKDTSAFRSRVKPQGTKEVAAGRLQLLLAVLRESIKVVPSNTYAFGVVGVVAAASACILLTAGNWIVALAGGVTVFTGMVILRVFAESDSGTATGQHPSSVASIVVTWTCIAGFIVVFCMLIVGLYNKMFGNTFSVAPTGAGNVHAVSVSVRLRERYTISGWSTATFPSPSAVVTSPRLDHNPKNDRDANYCLLTTSIPDGSLMEKGTVKVDVIPANLIPFTAHDAPSFSNEDRTVSVSARHWINNQSGENGRIKFILSVQYHKPVVTPATREVVIKTVAGENRIPLGKTIVDLSSGYQSFELDVHGFDGKDYVLTPLQMSGGGVDLGLEKTSPPRLHINVSWPEGDTRP